jgi:RHH-type proline utilization regulon transcriptional repressor/proline dehydrogenase/delta 1-pyrroline-5-carboxylate dehydrogenase
MNSQYLDSLVKESVSLAKRWQDRANQLMTSEEKDIQEQMLRLLAHPVDKVVLTKMIDQSFRSHDNSRVADQVNSLLRDFGVPDFFSKVDRLLIQMFLGLGRHFPALTVPKMIEKMRRNSSRAIIPGEPEALHSHLQKRKKQGVRMNINHLGEAVLGEDEARRRLEINIADMKNPEIEYISVKISTICSQIHPLAFDYNINLLRDRLTRLFLVAKDNFFVRQDGTKVPKFVNLDMEEYRDLEITTAAFVETLEQKALWGYSAGIALQAYLPDSYNIQKELTSWAINRVKKGGGPIRIRIVKGANKEMEQVEASIYNWPLAPYNSKLEVDANFKRMVEFGMHPENVEAVRLGIASHNLFELAFAYRLAEKRNLSQYVYFEMLEGMADHVRRALSEISAEVLLYAPVATKDEFINAIAYLVRRLDENTGEQNFLRYACNLKTESKQWDFLEEQFIASCFYMDRASKIPNRIQNRFSEIFSEKRGPFHTGEFMNEPDTDWSLAANRKWAESIREKWKNSTVDKPILIPIVVSGRDFYEEHGACDFFDSSQDGYTDDEKICVGRYTLALETDVMEAVKTAKADPDGWRQKTYLERHEILSRVAMAIREGRGDLIGITAASTGKVFTESDVEVSEAMDFTEYYPFSAMNIAGLKNIACKGKGVGVVISPWNFPIAIPCGGIMASLAAGNTVIFKPASSAAMVAWELCRLIWSAGISKNVLQFLPCSGTETASKLTNHPDVDYVIFTGGTTTGLKILKNRPDIFLAGETGGKNATIVTNMSDRDQAVKNVVHSAFSNCGQKCSATSLLILEKEVFEDNHFKGQLVDAAKSYKTGSVWDFENKMGPLIKEPERDLKNALTRLESGETWALEPQNIENNPALWKPGIKWNVQPGSYTHMTEFFGPVLGVMCAENLDQAIELANQTGYGLTSGLETLDVREQERWKSKIRAGNLYINRGTTGAVVLRQPFGGMGKSSLGAGIKVGGPNYVTQFMDFEETMIPSIGAITRDHYLLRLVHEWNVALYWGKYETFKNDLTKTVCAVKSYLYHLEQEFSRGKDYFHIRGQDNILRYIPVGKVVVRMHQDDTLFDVLARIAAAKISGCSLEVSVTEGLKNGVTEFLETPEGKRFLSNTSVLYESDSELIEKIPAIHRIRYAAPDRVPDEIFKAAAESGFYISRTKVLMEGRIELLQYFQEQSVCNNYHRYGNLGERGI